MGRADLVKLAAWIMHTTLGIEAGLVAAYMGVQQR